MPYAEDYTCIVSPAKDRGGLFIGNLQAAQSMQILKQNGIKAILTAARGVKLAHKRQEIPYYLHIHADDNEQFQLSKYFNQASNFIRDALQRTNVMVHCLAGVSRSVSLVIAYLIKESGKGFDQAFSFVKAKRRVVHPNCGFVKQLRKYEGQIREKGGFKERRLTPLAELAIEKNTEPQKEKYIKQPSVNKCERVPGRIKRFNSLVQKPQQIKQNKLQHCTQHQNIQNKILSYKQIPQSYNWSTLRSHFPSSY